MGTIHLKKPVTKKSEKQRLIERKIIVNAFCNGVGFEGA
jgi:hypothetical protein